MTQEEKKLLEVELATRSQYGVICAVKPVAPFHELEFGGEHKIKNIFIIGDNDFTNFSFGAYQVHGVENIKPYLRPMSSMTEEEKEEFRSLSDNIQVEYGKGYGYFFLHCVRLGILPGNPHECIDDFIDMSAIDWLNAHHFDYRGLIEKGLAIEAPEDMYKTE